MNDLSINQRSKPQGSGWWAWEVWLDGPDGLLDQVTDVVYTLHPTFPDPRRRVTDRVSRFSLRAGGWGEFMIYAEVTMRDGTTVALRHWLRLQEVTAASGRTLFLTGAKEDEKVTDDVQASLEGRGFTIVRIPDATSLAGATAAVAILSSGHSPWFDNDLAAIHAAGIPLLIVALKVFEIPACVASYRCPPDTQTYATSAVAWLMQMLDRPQLPLDQGQLPSISSAFWNRRLSLAAADLSHAARSVFPLFVGGKFHSTAVAVSPNLLLAVLDSIPPEELTIHVGENNLCASQISPAKGFFVLQVADQLPSFFTLADSVPESPLIAAIGIASNQKVCLVPGWLTKTPQPYELAHDATNNIRRAALVALENGTLLGLELGPGHAIPAELIRQVLPAQALTGAGFESVAEGEEDFFERAKTKPEDYANRKGYDENFLGSSVALPLTTRHIDLLSYTHFSVALSTERRLTLYAAVNINGRRLVEKHRAGDPWQFDPRVPEDHQVGGKYYSGTPLDRGHMVRRLDPVWGKEANLAELDTFHYPNSCPQHKNLNRKIWNDLEDYIYDNLQQEDLKVTVFTGPVLAGDDALFHGIKLPKEFWKVVVMVRDDGALSATAYLLSQEDMIEGLEFVFGEFRTYQVTVTLIEKKTGLDFGSLRSCDPKARKATLEAVESLVTEIREAHNLELDKPRTTIQQPRAAMSAAKPPAVPAAAGGAWDDTVDGERRLNTALDTFDWTAAEQLNNELIASLSNNPSRFDDAFARRIMTRLQHKRRFSSMISVGDVFLQQGFGSHQILRRYSQALIDQGYFYAADLLLHAIIADTTVSPFEQEEAQGLLGRCGKQIYVNANAPRNTRNVTRLQGAVDSYWLSYALNPLKNYWHGINVVACLRRAESDGVTLKSPADPQKVATDILKNLQSLESESRTGELEAFELATFIEVHVALGEFDKAIGRARMYAECKDADAFEIASTLRQFEEVWRLKDTEPPGSDILPILRAALLKRQGGALQLSAAAVRTNLEKVFGPDKSVSLKWYQDGLERAKSIARIETNDKGFGTGWLVKASDFFPKRTGFLLVTNAHVIGPPTSDRYPGSLRPEDATVHFQIQSCKVPAGKVAFHSPVNELDATFLELPTLPPDTVGLPIDSSVLQVGAPPQRLYIIGHPGGRDLEFSLQDNHLLAANERLVHYRTPSEGGSSGSPVFGPTDWKVVALHHAGRADMPRLDGQAGTYEANEGIALNSLCRATSLGVSAGLVATR